MFFNNKDHQFSGTILYSYPINHNANNDTLNYNTCTTREEYERKKLNERKQHESEMLKYYKAYDKAHNTNKYCEYKKMLDDFDKRQKKQKNKSKLNRIIKIIVE